MYEKYCPCMNWNCPWFDETIGACYGSGQCEYDYWLEWEAENKDKYYDNPATYPCNIE